MSYRCNTPGAAEPFWERAYQDFDGVTFAGGKASREFYELVKLLPAGSKVLDIGCGDGRHALFLAENGYAVTAIDISAAGISKIEYLARQKSLSIVTQVVDMRKYCFTEDFDLIIAHGCLHFVERPQWQDLLANMKAHTTPNGFNVVTVFTDTIAPPEDLKAFCLGLFSEGEIYDCYSDWKILHQESYILKDEHPNTLPHEHPINKIVAQKSKD